MVMIVVTAVVPGRRSWRESFGGARVAIGATSATPSTDRSGRSANTDVCTDEVVVAAMMVVVAVVVVVAAAVMVVVVMVV